MNLHQLVENQRAYFNTRHTLNWHYRKEKLISLKEKILAYQEEIIQALYMDLGKSKSEAYMTEIGLVLEELSLAIKRIKRWTKIKKKKTPLSQFKSKSYLQPSPYGVVFILSPWNYPFLLSINPLIGAIAAGNTVILKPSEYSSHTSEIIKKIIQEVFKSSHVCVVLGDATIAANLLKERSDYIFFTGGLSVGRLVYEAASKNLTPVTLELGGKSPTIVDATANLDLAAKRIVFGKFINCGQTCVAPDYVICHNSVEKELLERLSLWIDKLYPDALNNNEYGKLIHLKHYQRLVSLLKVDAIYKGGCHNELKLKIEPTILNNITLEDEIMKEEIFGPILPVLSYSTEANLWNVLNCHPNPLACYIFSKDNSFINKLTTQYSFGGGCINDTIIHLATTEMPFGGVGNSGIGGYHGYYTFALFSHMKSIVRKSIYIDLPFRYTPITKLKYRMIHFFLK